MMVIEYLSDNLNIPAKIHTMYNNSILEAEKMNGWAGIFYTRSVGESGMMKLRRVRSQKIAKCGYVEQINRKSVAKSE